MIPLLMLFLMPIFQIIWSKRRVANKTNTPIWVIAALCLLGGIIASIGATVLLLYELPTPEEGGPRCVSGAPGLAIIGIFINAVTAPLISYRYSKWIRIEHNMH